MCFENSFSAVETGVYLDNAAMVVYAMLRMMSMLPLLPLLVVVVVVVPLTLERAPERMRCSDCKSKLLLLLLLVVVVV